MSGILQLRNISKSFLGVRVLNQINLDFDKGEIHALVGENGAGKSTLMNIVSGVYPPDEGEIFWKGHRIILNHPLEAQKTGIGMIHQEIALLDHLTVAENICLGHFPDSEHGFVNSRSMRSKAKEVLETLQVENLHPDELVGRLSTSEKQLVEIAKVLFSRPELIIMDEATASLTLSEAERLLRVVTGLRERGVGIIYISHRMDEVFAIADKISVLRDGNLVRTSTRQELAPEEVTRLMVGRELKIPERVGRRVEESDLSRSEREVILSVRNLSRKGRFANVSFDLYKGEILGFAGIVGAGRTELMETIFGYTPPDEGEIYLKGKRVQFRSPRDAVKNGIGMVPEERKAMSCFLEQTVQDNINIVNMPNLTTGFILDRRKEQKVARSFLDTLRIKTRGLKQKIKYLSGGNQQKAILARWLAVNPDILILDEPTRGIDIGAKADIYQLIEELANSGTSLILVSSELPELLLLADRIVVMYKGSYKACLSKAEATEEKVMAYATNQLQLQAG